MVEENNTFHWHCFTGLEEQKRGATLREGLWCCHQTKRGQDQEGENETDGETPVALRGKETGDTFHRLDLLIFRDMGGSVGRTLLGW